MPKLIHNDVIGGVQKEEFGFIKGEDYKVYFKRTEAAFDKLWEQHLKVVKSGKVSPGFIASFPIADGRAMYRVEKTRPLTFKHIPEGDAWHIPEAHFRGLKIADLQRQLDGERMWTNYFRKDKANGRTN